MQSSGCQTVRELNESGTIADNPTELAVTLLRSLEGLDYVSVRTLAAAVDDGYVGLDDDSLFDWRGTEHENPNERFRK